MTRNLFYSAASASSALFMLALLAAAGQLLPPEDYGAFQWAIALATVAEVFMDFGLHQVTIRSIAKAPADAGRIFRTSLRLKVLPGVAMVLVFAGLAAWLQSDSTVRMVAVLLLASAVTRSYILTARGILQGLERFGADALVTIVDRALLLLCCVMALVAGAGLVQFALVFLGARVITTFMALAVVRRLTTPHAVGDDNRLWRHLASEALPVGLFLLVLNLYNRVDTLMLGVMVDLRAAGLYNTAYPIYEGLTYASAIITAVLVPRLSRLWAHDRAAHRQLVLRSVVATFALAVVVAGVAWPFAGIGIRFVFGAQYVEAVPALRWLLSGLPLIYVIWVLHAVAISGHRTSVLVWVTAAGTIFNVGLNLVLIPDYSYVGAAAATVASELVTVVLLLWGLRDTLQRGRSASAVSAHRA